MNMNFFRLFQTFKFYICFFIELKFSLSPLLKYENLKDKNFKIIRKLLPYSLESKRSNS
jgi:hypothetical protein